MEQILSVALVIISILLITAVLLQSGRSAGLSGAISGGAEQMVGKQKARGLEAVLSRATVVLGVLFFGFALWLGYFM